MREWLILSSAFLVTLVGTDALATPAVPGIHEPTLLGIHEPTLLGIQWTGEVFEIDPTNGSADLLGTWGLGAGANAMAVSASGQHKVAQRDPVNFSRSFLANLDRNTGSGAYTGVVIPFDVRGLAFDGSGTLFGIADHVSTVSGKDELWVIDEITGKTSARGSTGLTSLQALAVAPDGTMFGWDAFDGLVRLDTTTGVATDVNPKVNGTGGVQFLTVANDGSLLGGADLLFAIDAGTGMFVQVGDGSYIDLRGCDFAAPRCLEGLGAGCAGSGGFEPRLSIASCVVGGRSSVAVLEEGLGGATALLFVGHGALSTPLWVGCPLNMGSIAGIAAAQLGGTGAGNGSVGFTANVHPTTVGSTFLAQAFVVDAGVARGFASTSGLIVRVQ